MIWSNFVPNIVYVEYKKSMLIFEDNFYYYTLAP